MRLSRRSFASFSSWWEETRMVATEVSRSRQAALLKLRPASLQGGITTEHQGGVKTCT